MQTILFDQLAIFLFSNCLFLGSESHFLPFVTQKLHFDAHSIVHYDDNLVFHRLVHLFFSSTRYSWQYFDFFVEQKISVSSTMHIALPTCP